MTDRFGSEPERVHRHYQCGWAPRSETVADLARRLQGFEAALEQIEPAYGELWPLFAARAIRPGRDPGPLRAIPQDELARLLDRRARFDPPQLPAPVGPKGYNVVVSANRNAFDVRGVSITVTASDHGDWRPANGVKVRFHPDGAPRQGVDNGVRALDAVIDAFEPDWAWAGATSSRLPMNLRIPRGERTSRGCYGAGPGRKRPTPFGFRSDRIRSKCVSIAPVRSRSGRAGRTFRRRAGRAARWCRGLRGR